MVSGGEESNFKHKSNTHFLFVGFITFLITIGFSFAINLDSMNYLNKIVFLNNFFPFTTHFIFIKLMLILGSGSLWLAYKKPTSNRSVIKRIAIPFLLIDGLFGFIDLLLDMGLILTIIIFLPYLIYLVIIGLTIGFVYLQLYLGLNDIFQRDTNIRIFVIVFLLILLFFPLWNFVIGKTIVYRLHDEPETHFKKTYLDVNEIQFVKQVIFPEGRSGEVYRSLGFDVALHQYLLGCNDNLCIHAEYEQKIGFIRIGLFSPIFFTMNYLTLNLSEALYFTDFRIITEDALYPIDFKIYNIEDVKPFVNFNDTENIELIYHIEEISCEKLNDFGIKYVYDNPLINKNFKPYPYTVICPDLHIRNFYRLYEKANNKTIAYMYTNQGNPFIDSWDNQSIIFKKHNKILKNWQNKFKVINS